MRNDSDIRSPGTFRMLRRRAAVLTVILLVVLGSVLRIAWAWCYQYSMNPDYGVVVLMVRHILHGKPWPIFFYGQGYMGSLEPLLSAAVAFVAGYSRFTINLGTALFGIFLLVLLIRWARMAIGPGAAPWALATALIGPSGYLHYLASPRGGYGAALFFSALFPLWAASLTLRERSGRATRYRETMLFGLLAGLACWSHYINTIALLCAGITLLIGLRGKCFRPRFLAILPAALIGLLPVLIWNYHNEWGSLNMSPATGGSTLGLGATGFVLFWKARLPAFLDACRAAPPWKINPVPLVLYFAACAPALTALRPNSKSSPATRVHLSAVLLYIGLFIIIFSFSSFARIHTPRYLLPLTPFLAMMAAFSATVARPRFLRWTARVAVIGVVVFQASRLPAYYNRCRKDKAFFEALPVLAEKLDRTEVNDIYTSFYLHGLNHVFDERYCFSDPRQERYRPYAIRLEEAQNPAILENYGGAGQWIEASRGKADYLHEHGRLHYNLVPPPAVAELPPRQIHGALAPTPLFDRSKATSLNVFENASPADFVLVLEPPAEVCGLRFWFENNQWPENFAVEDLSHGDKAIPLIDSTHVSGFFWSGPRFYWMGKDYHGEGRFPPRKISRMRITFFPSRHRGECKLLEMQILKPIEAATLTDDDGLFGIDTLWNVLKQRDIRRLYAERWYANSVHLRSGGGILTSREPRIYGHEHTLGTEIVLDPGSAVFALPAAEPSLRDCFDAVGIRPEWVPVGEFGVLAVLPEASESATGGRPTGIHFHGSYALTAQDPENTAAPSADNDPFPE